VSFTEVRMIVELFWRAVDMFERSSPYIGSTYALLGTGQHFRIFALDGGLQFVLRG
jgi:hypothetical protein